MCEENMQTRFEENGGFMVQENYKFPGFMFLAHDSHYFIQPDQIKCLKSFSMLSL